VTWNSGPPSSSGCAFVAASLNIAFAREEPKPVPPGTRAASFLLNIVLLAWGLAAGVRLW